MIVTTMNSTYEIDFAEGRVRRLNGKRPSELARVFGTEDGEWQSFAEAKRFPAGDKDDGLGFVWFFYLTDGGYLRTSVVQGESVSLSFHAAEGEEG